MNIIAKSKEITKKELYNITTNPAIGRFKDVEGQQLDIDYFVVYETTDNEGEYKTITAVATREGEVFASASKTIAESMHDILEIFEPEELHTLEVVPAKSRNGRTFLRLRYIG